MNTLPARGRGQHETWLEEILGGFPTARQAFEELSKKVDPDPLRVALEAVRLASPRVRPRLPDAHDSGKWVHKLLADLKDIARRIEKMNCSPRCSPEIAATLSHNAKVATSLREYAHLPQTLRDYSSYIKIVEDVFQLLTPKGETPSTIAKLRLIYLVTERTGSPHYEKLSVLLNAILNFPGTPHARRKSVEPDALRKLWDSSEKLRFMLFQAVKPVPTQLPPIPTRKP
jgi:hypothetical protein